MIMCVTALTACTGVTDAADDAFDSEAVDAIGDKVADWQLANLDDLSYIRSAPGIDNSDRRGWQHGALYVGMMNWAALQGNEKYFEPMMQISEARGCFTATTTWSGRCTLPFSRGKKPLR